MSSTLNLARKLRPKTFADVIGQDIAISMLRNSLYKNHFFPVYLFAGQKGCGKTSTARILAAALNCSALPLFQKSPATTLPCLQCPSCIQMSAGTHPDFIEIDAASHTGVDDVRTILESCNFMPLLGSKKIYLIDEAHMLSKAAFNAFLKILEEPPAHTMFMMATTEMLKIPDTVRSRAFQLHFSAIKESALASYLATICTAEHIPYEDEALALIIHETEGSARDALNLLEQIRFAHAGVTAETVRSVLGTISTQRMGELFALMLEKNTPTLLTELNTITVAINPSRFWQLLLHLIRTVIWHSYGVMPTHQALIIEPSLAQRIMRATTSRDLQNILNYLWHQEELFLNTPYKQAFLEKVCIDLSYGLHTSPLASTSQAPIATTPHKNPTPQPGVNVQKAAPSGTTPPKVVATPTPTPHNTLWKIVCSEVTALGDPLLSSIFTQATIAKVDESTGSITLTVSHASPFFIEKINDAAPHWKPIVHKHFAGAQTLKLVSAPPPDTTPRQQSAAVANPTPPPPTPLAAPKPIIIPQQKAQPQQTQNGFGKPAYQAKPKQITLPTAVIRGATLVLNDDNRSQWPYTALLSGIFPGKLEIISPEPAHSLESES